MADSIATGRGTRDKQNRHGRTPAQWYCYIAGGLLTLLGLLGFLADSTFDTGGAADSDGGNTDGQLQGDAILGIEVNGWENLMHLATGLVLLALAGKRRTAKPAALAIGIFYLVVALIGLIDGGDVLNLMPVNGASNVLHLLLGLLGIGSALASDADDRDHHDVGDRTGTTRARAHEGSPAATRGRTDDPRAETRSGRGTTLRAEDHDETPARRR